MASEKVNIGIVGLGFGKEFIPIYQWHPNANMYAICQRTVEAFNGVGEQYGVEKRYESFDELIRDPAVDAVHINSPSRAQSEENMTGKMRDPQFRADIGPLLSAGFEWDVDEAARLVGSQLIERLPGDPWKGAD